MASPAEKALQLLTPVLNQVMNGTLDAHDELSLLAATKALRELPRLAQINALDDVIGADLEDWEQQGGDVHTLNPLVAIAMTNLCAVRLAKRGGIFPWANDTLRTIYTLWAIDTATRCLVVRYDKTGNVADLDADMRLREERVRLTPPGPDRDLAFHNLAVALGKRYARDGSPADLTRRIGTLEEALSLAPNSPHRPMLLQNLAVALGARHASHGDSADIERKIALLEEAVRLTRDGPDRGTYLYNLALSLGDRQAGQGDAADLDWRITLLEEAVSLTPTGTNRSARLNNLGVALGSRYALRNNQADLEGAIRTLEEAVRLSSADLDRARCLCNLSAVLGDRYALRSDPNDLDRRVAVAEEAVGLTPASPGRPGRLSNLALALGQRYARSGNPADLARELALLEEAAALTPTGPERLTILENLAVALGDRYALRGDPADLDGSIHLHGEACAPDGPHQPGWLSNLAVALGQRYARNGDPADLEQQITLLRKTVALAPNSPNQPRWLSNLAIALADRYDRSGDPADLEGRITMLEQVTALLPDSPDRAIVNSNLANAVGERFDLYGDPADLTRRVKLAEEALTSGADGAHRPALLANLALALADYDRWHGDSSYVERRITLLEEASTLTPGSPNQPLRLSDLANTLVERYDRRGEPADLDRAIGLLKEALATAPSGPRRSIILNNQAVAIGRRYARRGDRTDLAQWLRLLRDALRRTGDSAAPWLARNLLLALLTLAQRHPTAAFVAYHKATSALDRGARALECRLLLAEERDEAALLARHGDLYDRLVSLHLLLADDKEVNDPAAAAVHRRAAYLAAERGKGRREAALLAARAAQPREEDAQRLLPEVERLRRELAALYARLVRGSGTRGLAPATRGGWLGEGPAQLADPELSLPGDEPSVGDEEAARLQGRADHVWAELRARLEALAQSDPDFAALRGFADPQPPEAVAAALPPGGALVLLYPLPDELAWFALPASGAEGAAAIDGLAAGTVAFRRAELHRLAVAVAAAARSAAALPLTAITTRAALGRRVDTALLAPLAGALHAALAPHLPPPDADHPPSLVLVPTGALHRLPLHALPWPSDDQRLLDGYAVSYATTGDVLAFTVPRPSAAGGAAALAPGLSPDGRPGDLPGALAQACRLAARSGGGLWLRREASVARLLDDQVAARVRWVALATHGMAGGAEAARSGLLLYDAAGAEGVWLTAQEIIAHLPLAGVEHLELGACSTHADDPAPGDRLAGLLRALLYRGARSVGATLLPVGDAAAALVSSRTWAALLGGEANKALALRAAVLRLRDSTGAEAREALGELAMAPGLTEVERANLLSVAAALGEQARPFASTLDWAPFVLHGAPLVAPS